MLDKIYGSYSKPRLNDKYERLWAMLTPVDEREIRSNSGMMQKKNEIIELWQLFERINPKVIVEIGVAHGGTFAGWCQLACDDATLIGIDRDVNDCRPRKGDQVHPSIAGYCEKMTEHGGGMLMLKRRKSHQTIIPINGWSWKKETHKKLVDALYGHKIDFLFHDVSPMPEDSAKDFKLYWPLIAPGGVFAIHDVAKHERPTEQKYTWWRKLVMEGPQEASYEYRYHDRYNYSMGIGVLFKHG
jgi:predicted O-methyltransferase YrrM